jgi:hypothetical protein
LLDVDESQRLLICRCRYKKFETTEALQGAERVKRG